jgi:hypothetical protein
MLFPCFIYAGDHARSAVCDVFMTTAIPLMMDIFLSFFFAYPQIDN